MLTKDEYCDLFEIQTRGVMAAAFVYSGKSPDEYWACLRGDEELTMRKIAQIGHITGYNMIMQLSENRHLERRADDAGQ